MRNRRVAVFRIGGCGGEKGANHKQLRGSQGAFVGEFMGFRKPCLSAAETFNRRGRKGSRKGRRENQELEADPKPRA
jgi:hypothetical protein